MSTVTLPDEDSLTAGHITGMSSSSILNRIERRLNVVGISADAASRMAKKPDAIRNMRRAAKNKKKAGVVSETVAALAGPLKTSAAWLLSGEGPEEPDAELRSEDVAHLLDDGPQKHRIKIKGYVGAGAEAHFYAISDEDFEEVDAPEGATDQTIAVEIRGKSWGPAMDGWLVFYDEVRSPVTEDLIGKPCVVGLSDDRILLKLIQRERDGSYTLLSNSNEPPIRDVLIEWAALVTGMRPR